LLQALPQAPQFASVLNATSQPLLAAPSQLSQPAEHVIAQTPCWHDGTPFALLHCASHAPQSSTDASRLASHPVPVDPSQSPKPATHVAPHVPAMHVAVAFAGVGHGWLHDPQWAGVVSNSASQPFVPSPSQSPNPA
jgi:hypothetical protein